MKKKIYSAPQQKVVILKSRKSLLAGSGDPTPSRGIQSMDEEDLGDY